MKTEPIEIWAEYQKGVQYLSNKNIYSIVERNEDFYDGRQWKGLESNNMPKPVFNILQRAGKYMVASIGTNDIAIDMVPFSSLPDDQERIRPISDEVKNVIEVARIKEHSKEVIRNAFVDGWGYLMQSYNPDVETGQQVKGQIENQIIDCTNVYFGNPYSNDIQTQPYIIVAMRQHISQVKEEAKKLGVPKEEYDNISADNDGLQANDDSTNLVTVLIKYFKEDDTVWFTKTTKDVVLIEPTDLGYKRYPLACFGWDPMKNSYCYNSPMTSVIPNQIFINKTYAIAQMYGLQSAFPKIVYDKNKVQIDEFLNSTSPQAVSGLDLAGKFMDFIKIPDFSNNILELAQNVISVTKDCLGVTDASLGNVRPDNTSAIIALQETSAVPLEIQKQNFYVFWEDIVRNLLDIMVNSYGIRTILTSDNQLAVVDFSKLRELNYQLNVEIGNGAMFSEVAQMNTLDKLVQAGYIDPGDYIDTVPRKYIPQKSKLLRSYQQRAQMMAQQNMMPQARGSNTSDETVPL